MLKVRRNRNLILSLLLLSLGMAGFNNCSAKFKPTQYDVLMTSADLSFSCDPNQPQAEDSVKRLTGAQFRNTINALVSPAILSTDNGWNNFLISGATGLIVQSFPSEGSYAKGDSMVYDTQDQRLSQPLLQAQMNYAYQAASVIIAYQPRLTNFVKYYANSSSCPSSISNTGVPMACVDAFIKGFGLRVLKRPVETANYSIDATSSNPAAGNDLAFYEGVYNDATNGGFDSLITVMLLAPDSVFLAPWKGTASGGQITLTNYETAAKFSYYYTDNPPDDTLIAAAQSGFTGSGNTLPEQADRLFTSAPARSRFINFYTQWIRPNAVPQLVASSNSPASTDLNQLRINAIQEMVDLTEYYTFGVNGRPADLVTGNISFAKTADLTALYGVTAWPGKNTDGSYDATTLVQFPPDQPRAGLFTRAGYAFSGARDNNLIIRGARIRKDYMCQNLVPPAAFVLSPNVTMQGPPTVRNIVVANTEVPGSACIQCHQPHINPLGFALENYDAFGRYRLTEPIFNTDGTINTTVPVNAESQPLADDGNQTDVSDPITFSQEIGNSREFNSCFVKHFFRYAEARYEDPVVDGCKLNKMLGAVINDPNSGSIQNMVKALATDSSFKIRYVRP